ncbi:unnamed protein product, partial [Ixodes pacificus]
QSVRSSARTDKLLQIERHQSLRRPAGAVGDRHLQQVHLGAAHQVVGVASQVPLERHEEVVPVVHPPALGRQFLGRRGGRRAGARARSSCHLDLAGHALVQVYPVGRRRGVVRRSRGFVGHLDDRLADGLLCVRGDGHVPRVPQGRPRHRVRPCRPRALLNIAAESGPAT